MAFFCFNFKSSLPWCQLAFRMSLLFQSCFYYFIRFYFCSWWLKSSFHFLIVMWRVFARHYSEAQNRNGKIQSLSVGIPGQWSNAPLLIKEVDTVYCIFLYFFKLWLVLWVDNIIQSGLSFPWCLFFKIFKKIFFKFFKRNVFM